MKFLLMLSFLFLTIFSNAQMSGFLKSSEFERIKSQIVRISFNNIDNPFLGDVKYADDAPQITANTYTLTTYDGINRIFLDNEFVIFSYHLNAGSNTGTLIYNRMTQRFQTYQFNTDGIRGRILSIEREGYKNGHWWQKGIFNLTNSAITWSKNIDR